MAGGAGDDLIYGFDPNAAYASANIAATRVASGLNQPLFVAAPPGDTGRLFIVEKTGAIKILDLNTGSVLGTPFLSVPVDFAGERGLLGLAFDPNYASNGFFYIYRTVTTPATHNVVERYQVSGNPNVANAASRQTVINLDNLSSATNHNAGWIGFGPDGDLYIATGDNANGANAQTLSNLLGKILRIDVEDGLPYQIPSDNPFVGTPGARPEIFAYGLRNPWRASFDSASGALFIGDVGENTIEEINLGQKGANYGWPNCRRTELEPGLRQSDRVLQSQRRQFDHRRLRLPRRKRRAERTVFLRRFRARHGSSRCASTARTGSAPSARARSRPTSARSTIPPRSGRMAAAICTSSISTARSIGSRRPSPHRTSATR